MHAGYSPVAPDEGEPGFPMAQPQQKQGGACRLCCRGVCCLGLLVLFLVLAAGTFAATQPFRAGWDDVVTYGDHIVTGRIKNGLEYAIVHNRIPEGVVSTYLWVDVGSMDEDEDQLGLAHFLEHLGFGNTEDYPGRGRIWSEIENLGAGLFNAFTTWRTTNYELWDVPSGKLQGALKLQANQVLHVEPWQPFMEAERGAVLGEARLRNTTAAAALDDMLRVHGGSTWRPAQRETIGEPAVMKYLEQDAREFYKRWYHLDGRMRLLIVGDVSIADAKKAVEKVFGRETGKDGKPRAHPGFGTVKPTTPIHVRQIPGADGVDLTLMMTHDYVPHPRNGEDVFHELTAQAFSIVYGLWTQVRYHAMYPDESLLGASNRGAGVFEEGEYQWNKTISILRIDTPGEPHQGNWRRDYEMAIGQLLSLAHYGPGHEITHAVMNLLHMQLLDRLLAQLDGIDSKTVLEQMIGGLDWRYQNPGPIKDYLMRSEYLGVGFVDAFILHVRVHAASMVNALSNNAAAVLNREHEPGVTRYAWSRMLRNRTASVNVVIGNTNPDDHFDPRIRPDNIAMLIEDIIIAQPPDPPSTVAILGMLSESVNAAGGFPADVDLLPTPKKKAESVFNEDPIHQYRLANGVHTSFYSPFKAALPAGVVELELVGLGGRSSLPQHLQAACHLVNSGFVTGFELFPRDNLDSHYYGADRFQASQLPKLRCADEFLSITLRVHAECDAIHYATSKQCFVEEIDWQTLMMARLAAMPVFTDVDVRRAAAQLMEHQENMVFTRDDNLAILQEHVLPHIRQAQWHNDTRMHYVHFRDYERLSASGATNWFREHFVPGRFEVNIVGWTKPEDQINLINHVLGSMPSMRAALTPRVGHDPYADHDVQAFRRRWASVPKNVTSHCELPSLAANRAFSVMTFPLSDARNSGSEAHKDVVHTHPVVADKLLGEHMFRTVRRDGEFSYFAFVRTWHSVLFPGWGEGQVIWAPGPYPKPVLKNDPLNIKASTHLIKASLSSTVVDKEGYPILEDVLRSGATAMAASYDKPGALLRAMRFVGLDWPAVWPKELRSKRIKSPKACDVRAAFTEGSLSPDYFATFWHLAPDTAAVGSIVTVDDKQSSKNFDCFSRHHRR